MTDELNWVDKRARIEQHLANAEDVWQAASTAIHNCCASFTKHYAALADVQVEPQNGHRLLVKIRRSHAARPPSTGTAQVQFSPRPAISVTIGSQAVTVYDIKADADHAFIAQQNRELSPDEFSRLALEKLLFPPEESRRQEKAGA